MYNGRFIWKLVYEARENAEKKTLCVSVQVHFYYNLGWLSAS